MADSYFGEALALMTAVIWSVAVILFKKSGETVHPLGLNFFKNTLTMVLVPPTMLVFDRTLIHPAPFDDYLLLLLSGVLGIGIADTLFFKSLNILGAARSAIVDCLYSPVIILLSIFWLGERLTWIQAAGALLIVSAVLTIGREKGLVEITRRQLAAGILLGAAAMFTMGVGIVMIKPLLDRSPVLWAIEVRLVGAAVSLLALLGFHPGRRAVLRSCLEIRSWKYTIPGSVLGTYIALMFWIGGMKYAPASIASALNQTSNIFIFLLAALFLQERITRYKVAGIVMAVIGVFLVVLD
ncbi:MAG: DMT family transporter [Acidobacteria bacterium]|nr:DMT family transporter [Acidobacteriota bacterium]